MSGFTNGFGLVKMYNAYYAVWEQEAKVGPMMVLPARQKSGHIPVEEVPSVLNKISRLALYGSQWRSGTNDRVGKSRTPNHKNLEPFRP